MDAENFFSRWSRRKAQARQEHQERTAEEKQTADDLVEQPAQEHPPPTMEDVAALTPQSDFRRFLVQGVDPAVRRSAIKKMLSDPHFNVMDGLDIYIDDYNKYQPLPDAMLAALNHAQGVLNPQPLFDSTPERLLDETSANVGLASDVAEVPSTTEAGSETGDDAPIPLPIEVADSPADEETTAGSPDEQTEKPEDGPDHGNQISRM